MPRLPSRDQLDNGTFHLVICNLDSADSSGLDLAREIVRGHPDTATVVLVTGEDDPEAAKALFAQGVFGYLVEPFWPGQLLITVMRALRRWDLEIAANAHSQNLEDRRQAIIDMAPIGIYAKDVSGHYIVANDKANELAGLQPGELVGLTDEAFLSPPHLAASANLRNSLGLSNRRVGGSNFGQSLCQFSPRPL